MITEARMLNTLRRGCSAMETAQFWYAQHGNQGQLPEDLLYYLANGVVISRPDVLWMSQLTESDGEPCWFVRFACGEMRTLGWIADSLRPRTMKMSFCRNNDGKIRVYSMPRAIQHALAMKGI